MSDLIRREDALALTQRAIDGYGKKMRDATAKAEKRDWQSMLFAAVDIDAATRALPAVQPAHVNETPKNEHDERVMLAPNAALFRGPA